MSMGTREYPISVDSDDSADDDIETGNGRSVLSPAISPVGYLGNRREGDRENHYRQHNPIIIDNEDENYDDRSPTPEAEDVGGEQVEIDYLLGFANVALNRGNITRNRPVQHNLLVHSIYHAGAVITEGTLVEVHPLPEEEFKAQFLQVQLLRREGDRIILRGIPLTRARNLKGMLPLKRNEVVAILRIHEEDSREWTAQAGVEVNIRDVICCRKLQWTNALYPAHRYDIQTLSGPEAETFGILTCRWKMVSIYKKKWQLKQRIIVKLRAHEADSRLRANDDDLMSTWRGGKVRGGSHQPDHRRAVMRDKAHDNVPLHRTSNQKYTHADLFCGAGGVSCGVRLAGLKTILACDIDQTSCFSYEMNFPDTDIYQMSIHEFMTTASIYTVDILHLSPPCQFFSPAHTKEGRNDEFNLAGLFACLQPLAKLKPRIVTVEQTFGLTYYRFHRYFHMFLQCFTMLEYSVTYKVVDLAPWGLSQKRKRLIMIASCPGERLPTFPSEDALPGSVTIAQVLNTIPPGATLHDVNRVRTQSLSRGNYPKTPYSPNTLLQHIITTGGGNYHPSGERLFTLREYATLQGFPVDHEFAGTTTEIRRQIGNAFPPVSVEVLYNHLVKWLMKEDNMKEAVADQGENDDVMVLAWRERSATLRPEDNE